MAMDAFEKNMAVMRGEVLAANLLSTLAIRMALSHSPNPEEVLKHMSAYIEDTLNMSGPSRGDPDDEHNTLLRETARTTALQSLDAFRLSIKQAKRK